LLAYRHAAANVDALRVPYAALGLSFDEAGSM
jgi:hypothetical protein